MIARLRGLVDQLSATTAVIDVNGVGYLVACSGRTLAQLRQGQEAVLQVETHLREDGIYLYGFADAAERDWFRLLQTVQGVGARVALAILSALAPDALVQAIASGDRVAITRADGVGPKLAVRVLTELKDKAGGIALGTVARADPKAPPSSTNDAVSALVNLGYGRSEAFAAVAKAGKALGEGASLDALIRAGLKELAA